MFVVCVVCVLLCLRDRGCVWVCDLCVCVAEREVCVCVLLCVCVCVEREVYVCESVCVCVCGECMSPSRALLRSSGRTEILSFCLGFSLSSLSEAAGSGWCWSLFW